MGPYSRKIFDLVLGVPVVSKFVKIVVFVPEPDADRVRAALGEAGAGKIGKYSFCSFSTKGTGRFLPEHGATPHIGKVGEVELVVEERIETVCARSILPKVIAAMKAAHPYEEVAYDVFALENEIGD
jgi:hypothetical protein